MSLRDEARAPLALEQENVPEEGLFARIEQKYLLPKEKAEAFKAEVLKRLRPSYPSEGTQFTRIESVYYDSPDFSIFRMHFSSRQSRYKIRTRRYAPNGVPEEGEFHLELKSKDAGVSRKSRFRIGPGELGELRKGSRIQDAGRGLVARNRDLNERRLSERVERINDLVSRDRLQPSCIVRYRREAFEGESIRLTIDDQIEFEATPASSLDQARAALLADPLLSKAATEMRTKFQQGQYLVVEVKYQGTVPQWLTELLLSSGCQKAKFSKYCYSITSALQAK